MCEYYSHMGFFCVLGGAESGVGQRCGDAGKAPSACLGAFGGSVWYLGERGAEPGAAVRGRRKGSLRVPGGLQGLRLASGGAESGGGAGTPGKALSAYLGAFEGNVWRLEEREAEAGTAVVFSASLSKRKAGYVKYIHITRLLSQWLCPWVNIIHESFWPNTSPKQSKGDWPFAIFTCK